MAEAKRRRQRTSVPRLREDVIHDDDGSKAKSEDKWTAELDSLKAAIDDLTAKVNHLVALQTKVQKPPP